MRKSEKISLAFCTPHSLSAHLLALLSKALEANRFPSWETHTKAQTHMYGVVNRIKPALNNRPSSAYPYGFIHYHGPNNKNEQHLH